jgi:hypothetical protein
MLPIASVTTAAMPQICGDRFGKCRIAVVQSVLEAHVAAKADDGRWSAAWQYRSVALRAWAFPAEPHPTRLSRGGQRHRRVSAAFEGRGPRTVAHDYAPRPEVVATWLHTASNLPIVACGACHRRSLARPCEPRMPRTTSDLSGDASQTRTINRRSPCAPEGFPAGRAAAVHRRTDVAARRWRDRPCRHSDADHSCRCCAVRRLPTYYILSLTRAANPRSGSHLGSRSAPRRSATPATTAMPQGHMLLVEARRGGELLYLRLWVGADAALCGRCIAHGPSRRAGMCRPSWLLLTSR